MNGEIKIRGIENGDNDFLFEMLYEAIFLPADQERPPESIIEQPHVRKYVENFGRDGDVGFLLVDGDVRVGAIWSRLFSEEEKGYGFVDERTPELGIAIRDGYRNRGFGSQLIDRVLDKLRENGTRQVSLSVDKRNPALRLYERIGFKVVREGNNACVMVKKL
jgi:[ribosomal protein S18]-alanine N-acetyltransferase